MQNKKKKGSHVRTAEKQKNLKYLGVSAIVLLSVIIIALIILIVLSNTGLLYGRPPDIPTIYAPKYSDTTEYTDDIYTYVILDDGTAMITACSITRDMTVISVPDKLNGLQVSAIGDKVFFLVTWLTRCDIPEGITYIGDQAFYGCCYLDTVTLPSTLTSVQNNAFSDCDYLEAVIYNGSSDSWKNVTIGIGNAQITRNLTTKNKK